MSWNGERIELLRALWDEGLSASQIAERLGEGVTRNAVIGKAHRLGLTARPSPVKTPVQEVSWEKSEVASQVNDSSRTAAPVAPPRPAQGRSANGNGQSRVTLLDLNDKVCKWPIGHPGEPDFHFCGKPSQPSFPYCGEHCAVAYQAQLPRRDRSPRPLPPIRPR
jgi:GcrA cell cycle regulator